jgi:hypothetical protein
VAETGTISAVGTHVRAQIRNGGQLGRHLVRCHEVGLRDDGNLRGSADLGDLRRDEPVARPHLLVGGHAEADDVDLGPGRADDVVESLAQQSARTVQARRVDKDQLAVVAVDDPANGVARRLRLAGRDGDLVADQRIHESRLAGIGAADEAGETGPERVTVGRHRFHGQSG